MISNPDQQTTVVDSFGLSSMDSTLELKRTTLEREADGTTVRQKIRSLTDRQDVCPPHEPEDHAIPFHLRPAYEENVTSHA
jgi:hypothetical protein